MPQTDSTLPETDGKSCRGRQRVMSEQRRQQNRQAQKIYREKQKRHLQMLEDLVNSQQAPTIPTTPQDAVSAGTIVPDSRQLSMGLGALDCPNVQESYSKSFMCEDSFANQHMNSATSMRVQLDANPYLDHPMASSQAMHTNMCDSVQSKSMDPPLASPGGLVALSDYCAFKVPAEAERTALRTPAGSNESMTSTTNASLLTGSLAHLLLYSGRDMDQRLCQDILDKRLTLQDILSAGLSALSSEKSPSSLTFRNDTEARGEINLRRDPFTGSIRLPDLRRNTIQITQMTFVAACFANGAMLGLSPAAIADNTTLSPFYNAQVTGESARDLFSQEFSNLKPDLRPSSTQFGQIHHAFIDTLPFPTFRERIITLLNTDPPLFDSAELCHDLQNDGLICWGTEGAHLLAGSGSPWDRRSWEAKPWFLKKWWMLTGGVDGEMYQQTRWWSEMRGERPL